MLVKRYHAADMQQAMDQILKELGPDAVILTSRKMRKKGFKNLFKRKILEVMVAYDPADTPAGKAATKPSAAQTSRSARYSDSLSQESVARVAEISKEQMSRIDKRIDTLDDVLSDFINKFSYVRRDITFDYSREVEELFCSLVENQVKDELAHIIARETDEVLKRQPGVPAKEIMEQVLVEQLGPPTPIQSKKFKQKIVLFIGPTGVGKTTSIVKLAADFAINQQRKVGIINTDTYRIAAQEQLKTYADILDIPLGITYEMHELPDEIAGMSDREIIFIDTAGKRPGDDGHAEDIQNIISYCAPEDVLLCVPATLSFGALREIVDSYSYIDSYKLVVTKLDETRYRGMILNLCWYTKKALAYFTTGQTVPDDIARIDTEILVKEIMGQKT